MRWIVLMLCLATLSGCMGQPEDVPSPFQPTTQAPAARSPPPPPMVTVTWPEGLSVDEYGGFAVEGDAEAVTWTFGDGLSSVNNPASHAYTQPGSYNASVTFRIEGRAYTDERRLDVAGGAPAIGPDAQDEPPAETAPRVIVGVADTGINVYHETFYRPERTSHPCSIVGYDDCTIQALPLSVGPDFGSYEERVARDSTVLGSVKIGTWYWIPQTVFIGIHCDQNYPGSPTDVTVYTDHVCILDDTSPHGTSTTGSVLDEAPDALILFSEGPDESVFTDAPVAIDIQSYSWGTAPYPLAFGNPAFAQVQDQPLCSNNLPVANSLRFRSAGNNGPIPNTGDCRRSGPGTYSVAGGYPGNYIDEFSGSGADFGSYMCTSGPVPLHISDRDRVCGTSFATPIVAGAAAQALLLIRQSSGYTGGMSETEVSPGVTHAQFVQAMASAATYAPTNSRGADGDRGLTPINGIEFLFWGYGWLEATQSPDIVACVLDDDCPSKSAQAEAYNDVRRSFAEP